MKQHTSFLSFLFLTAVKADLPVHCLTNQFGQNLNQNDGNSPVGTWNFYVSKDSRDVNLFQVKEVCTHQIPNRIQIVDQNH